MKLQSIYEAKAKQYSRYTQQWREVGDKKIFARSKWEYRYAMYLQILKENNDIKDWEHEPTTFWFEGIKRGVVSYKPDFLVIHNKGVEEYVEVKGFMDAKSKTKINRMRIYHPKVKLRVIGADWFKQNNKALKVLIREWD
jgi:hypothetical protein